MVQAVIFDLDGTLLDTIGDLRVACNAMLEEYGYPQHTREAYIGMIGDGVRKMIERALPKEVRRYDSIVNRCQNRFMEIYGGTNSFTVPFEGIEALLTELAKRNVKLAVLSNKPHGEAVKVVERVLKVRFEIVLGQSAEFPTKPDPKGIRHIVEVLGVPVEDCLYVGDGEMDHLTPASVGMRSLSALWGYRTREQLERVGATEFISCPEQVLKYLN